MKLAKGDFVGREALEKQRAAGTPRKLVGFEIDGRGIARQGYAVRVAGQECGVVASGSWSPTLEKAIGTLLLPAEQAAAGSLEIAVRRRHLSASIVPLPFYKRTLAAATK